MENAEKVYYVDLVAFYPTAGMNPNHLREITGEKLRRSQKRWWWWIIFVLTALSYLFLLVILPILICGHYL